MRVRREVLGDEHVDRAVANTTDLNRDFQEWVMRCVWGDIWARPGLERRMRSCIAITALVARGQFDELGLHIRAARRNGLTDEEIAEILLQCAVYCGVPAARSAFNVLHRVDDGDIEPRRAI